MVQTFLKKIFALYSIVDIFICLVDEKTRTELYTSKLIVRVYVLFCVMPRLETNWRPNIHCFDQLAVTSCLACTKNLSWIVASLQYLKGDFHLSVEVISVCLVLHCYAL